MEIEGEIIDVPAQVVAYLITAPIHPARAPEDVVEQRAVVDAGRRIVTLAVGGVSQYTLFGISSVPVARSAYREKEVLARYFVIDETTSHAAALAAVKVVVAVYIVDMVGGHLRVVAVEGAVALLYLFALEEKPVIGILGHPHVGGGIRKGLHHLQERNVGPFLRPIRPGDGKAVRRMQLEVLRFHMDPGILGILVVQRIDRIVPIPEFEHRTLLQGAMRPFGAGPHVFGIPQRPVVEQIVRLVALPYEDQVLARVVVILHPDNGVVIGPRRTGLEIHVEIDHAAGLAVHDVAVLGVFVLDQFRFPRTPRKRNSVSVVPA